MRRRDYSVWLMPILSGLILWGLWRLGAHAVELRQLAQAGTTPEEAAAVRRILLPLPGEILASAREHRMLIARATANTFRAAILGFAGSVVVGFFIALLLSSSLRIKRALYPWVLVLQMTPIVILAPIIAIWLGPGMASIAAVAFLIGFFPVVASTTMGLISTDRNLVDLFAICRASRWQEMLYLRIPYALPFFLTGIRIAGTLAPIGAITGDLFVGTATSGEVGIGFLTVVFKSSLDVPALYATAGAACALGFVFVGAVHLLHYWALRHWHPSALNDES